MYCLKNFEKMLPEKKEKKIVCPLTDEWMNNLLDIHTWTYIQQ